MHFGLRFPRFGNALVEAMLDAGFDDLRAIESVVEDMPTALEFVQLLIRDTLELRHSLPEGPSAAAGTHSP